MQKPLLQALVLADHVYQDRLTGKKIIAGTFNQIIFRRPSTAQAADAGEDVEPDAGEEKQVNEDGRESVRVNAVDVQRAGSPFVFVSLTEIRSAVLLELRYVDLENNQALMSTKLTVRSDDPLMTVEAIIAIPPLPTPHEGVYALELLHEDEMLGTLRINAVKAPEEA